jgi:DNA-directed RNA polymerase specialized sigma24 family protein
LMNLMVSRILDPAYRRAEARAGINEDVRQTKEVQNLEDRREVCLEEEVERLRRSGMSASEIARAMGVDEGWVESLVSISADEDTSAEHHG